MADTYVIVSNTKRKSDIWTHFGFRKGWKTSEIDRTVAICKLCDAEVKHAGGTTNLLHHMRRKHPSVSEPRPVDPGPGPTKKLKYHTETDGNNNSKVSQVTLRSSFNVTQPRLDNMVTGNVKYPPKSARAQTITDTIGRLIIKDLRPYSMFESAEFRDLMNSLDSRY